MGDGAISYSFLAINEICMDFNYDGLGELQIGQRDLSRLFSLYLVTDSLVRIRDNDEKRDTVRRMRQGIS